jgi:hypothetical protein
LFFTRKTPRTRARTSRATTLNNHSGFDRRNTLKSSTKEEAFNNNNIDTDIPMNSKVSEESGFSNDQNSQINSFNETSIHLNN